MHCHTAGVGAGDSGCFISPRLARSFKFGLYLKSFGVTRKQIAADGDQVIVGRIVSQLGSSRWVDRAVILALDGVVGPDGRMDTEATEMYVPDEYVADQVARSPHLLFGASVNPYRADALERLQRAADRQAVLVKWLPAIQGIDPGDPRLISFYEKLCELKLPLLTHTGTEHSFTRASDELCDPDRLMLPLQIGVTVIAAHASVSGRYKGERGLDRLARMMPRFPRLYADISALTMLDKVRRLQEVLRRPEFEGRLLYGTDYPLSNMPVLVSPWYQSFLLRPRQIREIESLENPWDRDVALKQALGVPTAVWTRAEDVLRLPAASKRRAA